jgi:ketosteroid isomerase-like protein
MRMTHLLSISISTMRLLLLASFVLGATHASSQSRTVRSDQEILIDLERQWDAAFHKQDAEFIGSLLADEFIATYSDGTRGDKAREIELAKTFNQQVDSRVLEDFIVKTFGNTAIVWFTQHLTGPSQGKTITITYQYSDVWVMRDGRWQCVASQSTRVAGGR